MSRYYCKNCGSESIEGLTQKDDKALVLCNFCKKTNGITTSPVRMVNIPDYETPEQYEKRTRKEITGDLAVWYRTPYEHIDPKTKQRTGEVKLSRWKLGEYHKVRQLQFMGGLGAKPYTIVTANFPEPPPDDWKPEE